MSRQRAFVVGAGLAGPLPLGLAPRWMPGLAKCAAFPIVFPFGAYNWLKRQLDNL